MRQPRRTAVAAALVAIVLAGAACGDDDGDDGAEPTDSSGSTTTTAPGEPGTSGPDEVTPTAPEAPDPESLTEERRAYLATADPLCEQAGQELQNAIAANPQPQSAEEQAALLARLAEEEYVPRVGSLLEQLRGLDPPADDAAAVDDLIARNQAMVDELATDPSVANDPSWVDENPRPLAGDAVRFGFTACFQI